MHNGQNDRISRVVSRMAQTWRASTYAVALALTLLAWCPVVPAAAAPPEIFVKSMAVNAIDVLSDRNMPAEQRRERFGNLIRQAFDAPAIARSVLAAKWATATPEQQARFLRVYERALIQIYTDRFFDYDGHSLQVVGSQAQADGMTLVRSTVATPTGSNTYNVDWIVSPLNGGQRFFDVVIDGISTNQTTRQDYMAVLLASGGDLDRLIALLEAKTP